MNSHAAAAASEPAGLVRVKNDDEVLEFAGEVVATATTRQPGKVRWLDITLYRVTDGTGRYVIARTGRSLAVHRQHGCNRGVPMPVSELPDDSVPCHICATPELAVLKMMPQGVANREADHHSATVCANATEMLARLRLRGASPSEDDGSLPHNGGNAYSAPAQRLLDEARLKDPVVEAAASVIRRL
jgi:hypothetical protein